MIKGLDHIGIAVKDLDTALGLWQAVSGAVIVHREMVASQGVEIVMLQIGSLRVELIYPVSDDSPVAKFLSVRGEGIHHLALACDSAQTELNRAKFDGVRLIDDLARPGTEASHVGFVHPRSLAGVLLEFVDHAQPAS